jgi:PAS domain S-box-containing protein
MGSVPTKRNSDVSAWAGSSLQSFLEAIPEAILVSNRAGQIVFANAQAEKLFGYSREALLGSFVEKLIPTSLRDMRRRERDYFFADQRIPRATAVQEIFVLRADNTKLPVDVRVGALQQDSETFAVSTIRDASARYSVESREKSEAAEAALANERLRQVLESSLTVGWDLDFATGRRYSFGPLKEVLGHSNYPESGVLDDFWPVVHPDDLQSVLKALADARENRTLYSAEFRIIWADGTVRWVAAKGRFFQTPDGKTSRALGMTTDITDRKHMEEALRESEERLHMAIQAGEMYAYEWNAVTDEVVRSRECAQILTWMKEPTRGTGREWLELVHPDDRHAHLAAQAAPTPENPVYRIIYRLVRPDGTMMWLERSGRGIFDAKGKLAKLIGMTVDITERKRTEESLRLREKELLEAQRVAKVGSWQWDPRSDKVSWSEELYRIAGRDPTLPPPTYQEQQALYTPESWMLLQHRVDEALRTGRFYNVDLEMVRPDGSTRWITDQGEVLYDTEGRVMMLRGTAQDVTERKRAEEALLRVTRRLVEAQEQERARIARDLHDDVNQRMALLAAQLEEVRQAMPANEELSARMKKLSRQTEEILSDIQAISHRLHSSKLEHLGIVAAMKGFCRECATQQKVEVHFSHDDIPSGLPLDISLCLFRVLQEALHNAVKHSGVRDFNVRLRYSPTELGLTVSDSGVGFDLKSASNQQGLGLVSMSERLRLVQGAISIRSTPEQGTTIDACVPLRRESKSSVASA